MPNYIPPATYRALKSRLTRALKSNDPTRILTECEHAFAVFEDHVWPDDWHRWNIAEGDARRALGLPYRYR